MSHKQKGSRFSLEYYSTRGLLLKSGETDKSKFQQPGDQ